MARLGETDASDSAASKRALTVPRWMFVILFAAALASHAWSWRNCGPCDTWPTGLFGNAEEFGAAALWSLEFFLPTHDWPAWARFLETMALAVLSVSVMWLLIRRFIAPRVTIWVFLLVLVLIPAATFACEMLIATAGGLIQRLMGV